MNSQEFNYYPVSARRNSWLTYDYHNIYVAFYCHDTEPDKIKTSISRRDNLGNDDWVGIDLDAMGKRQFTYDHLKNANFFFGRLKYSLKGN